MKSFSIIIILPFLTFAACTTHESSHRKNVESTEIYFDYKIRGQENDSVVFVYLLYRTGGPNGKAMRLNDSSTVRLDGETIPSDSAKLVGVFYDTEKPAGSFGGTHTIEVNFNDRQYREQFDYQPFKLKSKIPAKVNRSDLVFEFIGLQPEDHLRVILADTSFTNRDIHEIDTVENNKLVISRDKLKDVVNGPIMLLLSKETERPIKDGTSAGGRIAISYALQREFELR